MADPISSVPAGAIDPDASDSSLDRTELKARWSLEIERYERKAEKFNRWGKKIIQRYTAENKDDEARTTKYNILWSNLQTLRPALYAKDPTPEVERRYKDKDPVGRVASDVLERCLGYCVGHDGFNSTMKQVVMDRLLPGRGIAWVRYLPHMRDIEVEGSPDVRDEGTGLSEDPQPDQEVYWEEVRPDFVPWTDFGHTVARNWEEVDAVWRIAYLDRQELKKRFGDEVARDIPLDQRPEDVDKDAPSLDAMSKAKIYEIWDKRTKRAIWLHRNRPEVLDVRDDPLKLEEFFPCPKLLQATVATASYIPTADYVLWSDQAAELDRLTTRISQLTKAIKVVGVYDASVPALQSLLNAGVENRLMPIESFAAFAEKGGLQGAVELLDVKMIAEVLLHLYEARDKVKADLYEISGLSDLLRGASEPEETAAAQKIKASFASVRLKDMQRDVQCFARDLLRIMGQIICVHFSMETIREMSGVQLLTNQDKQAIQAHQAAMQDAMQQMQAHQQQMQQPGMPAPAPPQGIHLPEVPHDKLALMDEPSWEDVLGLLRDNAHRSFRIDIETDSTIAQDERQEQESRMEFGKTIGVMLEGTLKICEEQPVLAPAMAETFMFVLRAFKVGRPTESAFQEAMDKLTAMAEQPPKQKPDPAQIKAQADIQIEQSRAQSDMQIQQDKTQSDERLAQFKAQLDQQTDQMEQAAQAKQITEQQQGEERRRLFEAQLQAHMDERKAAMDSQMAAQKIEFDRWKAQLEAETKVVVAKIETESSERTAETTAKASVDGAKASAPPDTTGDAVRSAVDALTKAIGGMAEASTKPRPALRIVRDPAGKIAGLAESPDGHAPYSKGHENSKASDDTASQIEALTHAIGGIVESSNKPRSMRVMRDPNGKIEGLA